MKTEEIKLMIIENFIDYIETNEVQREKLKVLADNYVTEDHVDEIAQSLPTPSYNADFTKYYDIEQKRNIWVLGYFGGGSLNVLETLSVAMDYAKATGLPLESVKIDEVLSSRRFKGFKFVYSMAENQKPEEGTSQMLNVHQWLRD